jgi:hypothetical protein
LNLRPMDQALFSVAIRIVPDPSTSYRNIFMEGHSR